MASLTTMQSWAVACLLVLLCSQQCLAQSLPDLQDDITAYIIMGVILGVIVIIVIIILIVSCGRWNWNWREMNSLQNRKAVRVSRTTNIMQRVRRKPKLKLGMKKNTAFQQTVQSDAGGSSRALFVMGDSDVRPQEPDRGENYSVRTSAGPHVARLELDGTYVPSTNVQPPAPEPATVNTTYSQRPTSSVSQQHLCCPQCSNPNVSRIECPAMRTECQHHHVTAPVAAPAPAPAPAQAAIYPRLGDVMQPQHQIHIHAAVPASHHHHHPQAPAQAQPLGIYPNLGGHTHAHVVTQHPTGHVHSNMNLSPPAYQTMERTQQKY